MNNIETYSSDDIDTNISTLKNGNKIIISVLLFVFSFIILLPFFGSGIALIFGTLLAIIYGKDKSFSPQLTLDPKEMVSYIIVSFIFSLLFYFSIFQSFGKEQWVLPGISIFIWELFFLGASSFLTFRKSGFFLSRSILLFTGVGLLISLWFAIYTQVFFSIVFFILLLLNNGLFFIALQRKTVNFNSITLSIGAYFVSFLYILDCLRIIKNNGRFDRKFSFMKLVGPFLFLGLILSVVFPLLLSADSVFEKIISDILSYLTLDVYIFLDIGMIIFLSIFVFSFFLYQNFKFLKSIQVSKNLLQKIPQFDRYYENIVLGGMIVVYVLFVFVQFKYLFFGNHEMFLEMSLRYADYVHQGFYQLIGISAINMLLLYFFSIDVNLKLGEKKRTSKILYTILCILTLCMIYSAFIRINLYIDAYHLTILRFFVVYIIITIGVFYFIIISSLFKEIPRIHSLFFGILCLSFISVGYLNIDSYIAKYNLNHAEKIEDLDTTYILFNLSRDALDQKQQLIELLGEKTKVTESQVCIISSENSKQCLGKSHFTKSKNNIGYYYNYYNNRFIFE